MTLRNRLAPSLVLAPLALASLALSSGAQTGPFTDGELLVRARDLVSLKYVLSRVDPATGAGAVFLEDIGTGSASGWIDYDSYRDGILMYSAHAPIGAFGKELLLARSDGHVTRLGHGGALITAMAAVGDGRVYMLVGGALHVLDAGNSLTPVLDEVGVPVDLLVEHMIYDAPSNALIGATRSGLAQALCGSTVISVTRMPLNASGSQLSGPASCNGYPMQFGGAIVGLDPLPGGNILMTQADGLASNTDQLYTIDPTTLSIGLWASPSISDLDGGVWAQSLGKAVVHDDLNNLLRAYGPGDSGLGVVINTSVPIGDNTSGWGPANNMADIDITSPPCPGSVADIGQGLAGKGGFVPRLGAASCPRVGAPLPLTVFEGLGNSSGLLAASLGSAALPVLGATLYLAPPLLLTAPLSLDGNTGGAGKGTGQVTFSVPNNPGLSGVQFYVQAVVLDSAAVQGFSFSQGLEITIG